MKQFKFVIEAKDNKTGVTSFYPGAAIGTTIFPSIDSALDKISGLINKTSCITYKGCHSFFVKNLDDVKEKIDYISQK